LTDGALATQEGKGWVMGGWQGSGRSFFTQKEKGARCVADSENALVEMLSLGLSDVLVTTKATMFTALPTAMVYGRGKTYCHADHLHQNLAKETLLPPIAFTSEATWDAESRRLNYTDERNRRRVLTKQEAQQIVLGRARASAVVFSCVTRTEDGTPRALPNMAKCPWTETGIGTKFAPGELR
jgi:hypothetical protein